MGKTTRLRGISWTISASIIAIAAAASVAAQCSPDPTVVAGTTTCTGTDTDGLTVGTSGTQVTVASGAVVQAGP